MYQHDETGYQAFREMIELDRHASGTYDEYGDPDGREPGEPIFCAHCGGATGEVYDPEADGQIDVCPTCYDRIMYPQYDWR